MRFLLLKAETILGIFTVSSELYWSCVVDVVVFYGKEMIDVFCLDAVATLCLCQCYQSNQFLHIYVTLLKLHLLCCQVLGNTQTDYS